MNADTIHPTAGSKYPHSLAVGPWTEQAEKDLSAVSRSEAARLIGLGSAACDEARSRKPFR